MSCFIKNIVKKILTKNQDLQNLILIVPNHRIIYILQSEVKKLILQDNAIWMPHIYTVGEFMQEVSEIFLIDQFTLLLYFYNIFNKYNSNYQLFQDFIQWAPQILSDFDELDMNLINIKDFFSHMISYDDITQWNPNNFFETKKKIKQDNLWKILFSSYYELRNTLLTHHHAYYGLIFRTAVKKINNFLLKNHYLKKIIFIGLNNLSKSELKIIEHLFLLNKLEIYWDIDQYYYNNENQEAGLLFRYYFNNYVFLKEQIINSISNEFNNSKRIEVIQTTGKYNQLKIIEKILIDLTHQDNGISKTVIALPNEYMTIPILNFFDKKLKELNIELKCYFKSLALSQSYILLFNIFCNRQKSKIDNFSKTDLLDLFINLHFNTLLKCNNQIPDFLLQDYDKYISDKIIAKFIKKKNSLNILDPLNKNIMNFLLMLKNSIIFFKKKYHNNILEITFLNSFYKLIHGIQSLFNHNKNSIKNIESLLFLYKSWIQLETVNICNKTNHQLYLMEISQTTIMDFENVILITVNEGICPPEKYQLSLIPLDIRKIFTLSKYQKEDALYAYNFYHLIQRAKKIFLIYDNNTKLSNYGEKSRFIDQLTYESIHKIINTTFNVFPFFISDNVNKQLPIKIYKNFLILKKIKYLLYEKGISPSSINLYIKNPIEFYIQKILNLKTKQIQINNFNYQHIGIIVHNIIYDLYKPYINIILTIQIIQSLKKSLNLITQKIFQQKKLNFHHGKNFIEFIIIKKYVEKIISWDEKNILLGNQIIIKNIEYHLSTILGNSIKKIKLCGIIDRIDDFNGSLRIIDYKTGKVQIKPLNINSIDFEKILNDSNFEITLQLLIYIIIWLCTNKETKIVYAGIFALKNHKEELITLFIDKKNAISLDKIQKFLPFLIDKVLELINIEKPFIEKGKILS